MDMMKRIYGPGEDKPNAQAFIEDVLLPSLDDLEARLKCIPVPTDMMLEQIRQFIQSRRREWAPPLSTEHDAILRPTKCVGREPVVTTVEVES